jgi:AcrR family transcriptional regulator
MSRVADPTSRISLLRAAEEVFAERGLIGAKVEEITRRAGMSKGSFYLHFESKEKAFEQVTESFLARIGAMMPKPGHDMPHEPRELLRVWLEQDSQLFDFLWQNRAIVHIILGCQGDHVYLLQAFFREMQENSCGWVRFWKGRGLFGDEVDEQLAATLICGAYNELYKKMIAAPKKPEVEAWLRVAQGMVVRGFGTTKLIRAYDASVHGAHGDTT